MKGLKWVTSRFLFRLKCKVWFVLRSCFHLHNFELAVSSLPGFWCFFTEQIPCGELKQTYSCEGGAVFVSLVHYWCCTQWEEELCLAVFVFFTHFFSILLWLVVFSLSHFLPVSLSHHLSVRIEQNSDYVDWLPLSRSELATPHSMCSWKSNWNDRERNLLNRNWKKCTQIFIGWNLQPHH